MPVVLTPARPMTFEDRVVVSGSILAKQYALVSARIPGTLDAVFVDEGDRVEAGRTKLFETDAMKLAKAVARMKDLPGLKHVLTTAGKVEAMLGQSSEGVYLAQMLLTFPDRDQRDISIEQLMDMVRARMTDFPDAITAVSLPSFVGG